MENKNKNIINGMKILGASLLFLVIPGSYLALPWLIQRMKKNKKKESSNTILGI